MRNFTTKNVSINGTYLQGYLPNVTRRELEAAFGAPSEGYDGKTTTEWAIQFEDGIVATIYDWKRYELGAPQMDERITWNVGGKDPRALEYVGDALLVWA